MSDLADRAPGCVLLILDESAGMLDPFTIPPGPPVPGTRWPSRLETVATAVNALLKRLAGSGADIDLAIVGYRSNGRDADVGLRWQGQLSGRTFVSTRELAAAPLRVDRRDRTNFQTGLQEAVDFPVWYAPSPAGKSLPAAAFQAGIALLDEWLKTAAPGAAQPLVIHLFGSQPADNSLFPLARQLIAKTGFAKPPLLLQLHLSSARSDTGVLREPTVPATQYPASPQSVPPGYLWDLYSACSPLPPAMRAALRAGQVPVTERSVGLVANGRPLDVIQILKLVEVHTSDWPPSTLPAEALDTTVELPPVERPIAEASNFASETETTTFETPAETARDETPPATVEANAPAESARLLVVMLLDRSAAVETSESVCLRLQERMHEMLGKIAKLKTGRIDLAAISYGGVESGEVVLDRRLGTVETLDAGTVVSDHQLEAAALRIEQTEELVDDGVGGLVPWPRKKFVFFEQPPGSPPTAVSAAKPLPAFEAALQLAQDWSTRHAAGRTLLLHFTRAAQAADEIAAVATLPLGVTLLQQIVITESPQASVSYPSDDALLDADSLKGWFKATSVLPNAEELAAAGRAGVTGSSRGMVVNARFDLLGDLLNHLLQGSTTAAND